jgi:hypothetical protein
MSKTSISVLSLIRKPPKGGVRRRHLVLHNGYVDLGLGGKKPSCEGERGAGLFFFMTCLQLQIPRLYGKGREKERRRESEIEG